MTVLPMPPRGWWIPDARDDGRALRVSSHPEAGCVVLSTWRGDECVATSRLTPADAAQLVAVLAQALAAGVPQAAADEDPLTGTA